MTTIGENRERYAREVEPRPSRFINPAVYAAWGARADAWAMGAPLGVGDRVSYAGEPYRVIATTRHGSITIEHLEWPGLRYMIGAENSHLALAGQTVTL